VSCLELVGVNQPADPLVCNNLVEQLEVEFTRERHYFDVSNLVKLIERDTCWQAQRLGVAGIDRRI
jgi:hypothetical protein